jgi:hypothetical protein
MSRSRRKYPPPPRRWLLSEGDHYYLMLGNGMIELFPWNDTPFDHETWHFGTCFTTHAEARHARDTLTAVLLTFHEAQR